MFYLVPTIFISAYSVQCLQFLYRHPITWQMTVFFLDLFILNYFLSYLFIYHLFILSFIHLFLYFFILAGLTIFYQLQSSRAYNFYQLRVKLLLYFSIYLFIHSLVPPFASLPRAYYSIIGSSSARLPF